MLFNNTRKKRPSHLHYGTAKKAKQSLRYLRPMGILNAHLPPTAGHF